MTRKIAVVTGTRAEYGILKPILKKIDSNSKLDLYLIVVGMHLSEEFGYTIKEIEKDGFRIYAKLDTLNKEDTGAGMARYIGNTIIEISKVLENLKPDILLLLGDRGEMLAGAIAATCMNILIAHVHGGEVSGSIDEGFRHAISKLAHIHFVATNESKQKLISLGEDSSRIFVVGAPGLDDIYENLLSPQEIEKKYSIDLSKPLILLVQHPVVNEVDEASNQIRETLEAIVDLKYQTVVIYPNADAGGRQMIKIIEEYKKRYSFIKTYKSLPRRDYLSLMSVATVMVGNSSSGIIEAPSFGLPVVNIGTRQKGRLRAGNVIDVSYNREEIKNAILKAIQDRKFKEKVRNIKNPWGDGKASERIVNILSSVKICKDLLQK
ncbi:MAG TPA: UDP-N-acetylglucosamine 2-epimerase (hydrolyzing) [Candidatus Nanopusillus sp.]|nr:UDP-N-acetylglucosamine 2-epimerase (hydrolyzing) [Candidatus Nanopusillus sp.]